MSSSFDVDEVLRGFYERGYARLGPQMDEPTAAALRARIDAIMLGEIAYDGLFFQRDADTGRYDDLSYGRGFEGPTLRYRKVEKLEKDPLFFAWIQNPAFELLAKAVYRGPVSMYRAVVFNKAAEGGGSELPWHQDGGEFWGIDRQPVLQVWTALDDAPEGGGCLEVVPGTHLEGLVTPQGGVVPDNHIAAAEKRWGEPIGSRIVALPAKAGEVILVHNLLWHRSGRGRPGIARRAFTVCYMDAETRCKRKKRAPREFVRVFD